MLVAEHLAANRDGFACEGLGGLILIPVVVEPREVHQLDRNLRMIVAKTASVNRQRLQEHRLRLLHVALFLEHEPDVVEAGR